MYGLIVSGLDFGFRLNRDLQSHRLRFLIKGAKDFQKLTGMDGFIDCLESSHKALKVTKTTTLIRSWYSFLSFCYLKNHMSLT